VNEEIHIRPMTATDIEAVMVIAAGLRDAPHWDGKAYEAAIARAGGQKGIALVAEAPQSGVAGFTVGGLVPPDAEIESIVVRPGLRRQGLARQLFTAFSVEAQRLGCSLILLEARSSNAAARAFYQSLGFTETARRPAYYADPVEDAILMARTLP
jgi:ribosomal-protein-alanine N-acetyltransferase